MIIKPMLSHYVKPDGKQNIRLYVYDKRDQTGTKIKTDLFVEAKNFKQGKVIGGNNAQAMNVALGKLINDIERYALDNPELNALDMRHYTNRHDAISFYKFCDKYFNDADKGKILHKGRPLARRTIETTKQVVSVLREHYRGSWSGINSEFFANYVYWLRSEKGYSDNTITKHVKKIKMLMSAGRKHHKSESYKEFSLSYKDADNIALSEAEIDKIMKASLPEHLINERDRFFVSYNLLMRYGDNKDVSKANVFEKNGKHYFKNIAAKTLEESIIPLFPKTLEILKKHDYKLPLISNQKSNANLKQIGLLAGITAKQAILKNRKKINVRRCDLITTHTARRSMATNLLLNGFDLKAIQLMGGWKSLNMLEKYLKIDKLANAIKAAEHPFFK